MTLIGADIFGDDAADDVAVGTNPTHADREWNKLQNEFTNAGFREGAIAGKEAALQDGFDHGFDTGAPVGRSLGVLRGYAAAALAIVTKDATLQALEPDLRDIIAQLSNVRLHELVKDEPAVTTSSAHPHSDLLGSERSEVREMDELEAALGQLGSARPAEGIDGLRARLQVLLSQLGLPFEF
ncbi:hypothetical protein EXIGLDRAFT_831861 [Exidia glandulosa HHB12029]|uniref:Protein YAE1 n=1 Tax=Exidia glandulosa HHB12029 TaxID=1314781 RepID=A0A165M779_EXIGL|nr:hypothetical protein EXIGLDRAFT_831861 [Exidia glandulosa HHB12029]